MDDKYRTLFRSASDEIIINKSRFIGYARPIDNEDQALDFINTIKEKHRDATHNVYAYVVGGSSNVQRFSDDGEPSGTAGIPALEVLKKEDLRNTVVVVTRYFGGVKLGGGGLIRAYTRGAKIALDAAKIVEMVLHRNLKVTVDYNLFGRIENYLMSNSYSIDDTIYGADVDILLPVSLEDLEDFKKAVANMSNGTALIEELEDEHLAVEKGQILKK